MNPRRSTVPLVPLAFVLALLAPCAAGAATFCVPNSSPGGCDQTFGSVDAAAASPLLADGDTIKVAPGDHPGSGDYGIPHRVRIIGAGATQTRLTAPDGESALHFVAGGELYGVRLNGGGGDMATPPGPALELTAASGTSSSFVATDVAAYGGVCACSDHAGREAFLATADPGASMSVKLEGAYLGSGDGAFGGQPAVRLSGRDLVASLTGVEASGGNSGIGVAVEHEASASLTASEVSGIRGVQVANGTLNVSRTRISVVAAGYPWIPYVGLAVIDSDASRPSTATVTDSLITALPAQIGEGRAVLVNALASGNSSSATITGSTLVAGGLTPSAALEATGVGGIPAGVNLRNSIALLDGPADADSADFVADGGSIAASTSSFTSAVVANGGSAPAAGAATNLSGAPGLVNPAAGDFGLVSTSPLVDRGDPSLVSTGQLDLSGSARSLDGNGDCLNAPDIGAFELTGRAAPCAGNIPPALSRVSMSRRIFAPAAPGRVSVARRGRGRKVKRGTRFRYTLSEAATIRIAVERAAKGRRAKGRCRKPTRKNRKGKRCTRHLRVGTLRASETAGKQSTSFTGRFGKRALGPAHYRARLSATDAQGARSKEKRLKFRVLRAR